MAGIAAFLDAIHDEHALRTALRHCVSLAPTPPTLAPALPPGYAMLGPLLEQRGVAGLYARRSMRGQLWGQGLGRHSDEEIVRVGQRELTALSEFLADKKYLLGDEPTTVDCSAFGLVNNIMWPPIESALKEHARGLDNLVAYCGRIRDDYFGDLGAPVSR